MNHDEKLVPAIERAATSLSPQLLHDLRSPLNQIIGYSEMLSEEGGDRELESFVKDLNKIRDAGLRMLTLIEKNFTTASGPDVPPSEVRKEFRPEPRIAHPAANTASGHLLVVDDDPNNRDVLCRRLKIQGHTVETVSNGLDALRIVQDRQFDLVLLDIMMPEMDGYEVLSHLKSNAASQQIPVIMISALSEVKSVVRCIEAGAEDYLTKPFDSTLLKARVSAALEKKRGRDRETALFEQLQANYRRLQESEALRDDMRNMIVHDLRTPLTSVIVGVEMLEKHGELNETQREMMTIAVGGGKTLLGMINDLLDVEKMESGSTQLQLSEVTADSLVSSAIEQVVSLAQEGDTTLLTDIDEDLPPFPADEQLLSRTLVNLIANAIKFTPGGSVTVSASEAGSTNVRFAIRDTGDGIPAEAFDRIFEKFGQLGSRTRVGTGLGLAFCKLAVEAHGGRIEVESKPSVGSTFSFTIPMASQQPAARSQGSSGPGPATSN